MNQVVQINPTEVISACEENFTKVNSFKLDFKKEALFARQALTKNDRLFKTANANPNSLKNAILNVSAIGISLNPSLNDAYLVPRGNSVCLDISYKGLIKVATESGAIKWCKADIVYYTDSFVYKGVATMPEHNCDPFTKDRGSIKGVYCIAKTQDDDILVEVMTLDDIQAIKNASPSATSASSPWNKFEGEMCKKACIKRASKTWPRVEVDDRLREAIDMLNESEGYEFGSDTNSATFTPDERLLALAAPKATQLLQYIETKDYWNFGTTYTILPDKEKETLNIAKSKGGFFSMKDKQDISDLLRQFYTEKNQIEENLTDSFSALSEAFLEGDELRIQEIVTELDEKEIFVALNSDNFDDSQRVVIEDYAQ